ncbi:MAG: hypothetical protein R3C43_19190 [Chloroflexota bacterium]
MARTQVNPVALPNGGYNLTDSAALTTLATGAGNGVEIAYDPGTRIILKNPTGGAAAYTVKVPTPAEIAGLGSTVPDMTVTVAAGKSWILKPLAATRQAGGNIYIDCDVAGQVLVVK